MKKEFFRLPEKIKTLRDRKKMTQADLARELGITRASVNSWEMGLAVPSTALIVELSHLFHVSTDYLLGVEETASIKVDGLKTDEVAILVELVLTFKRSVENAK
jgi:transcriptional regulator with XRE-family HTH domain